MKKEEIEKLINSILNKLPMLKAVKETDLFLFRREKDILLLIKQFSFIILYYLLNIYWPHISKLTTSRRFKAFYHFIELLIKNDVMPKLTKIEDPSKLQDKSIIYIYVSTRKIRFVSKQNYYFHFCLRQSCALLN